MNDRFGSRLFTLRCTKDWYRIAKRTFGSGDTGTVKIPVIEFTITEEFDPEPLDMSFTATLVDDDDDSSMDTFDIDLMV